MARIAGADVRRTYVDAIRRVRGTGFADWLDRLDASGPIARHLRSLFAIHDVEAIVEMGLPWWTYRASSFVERWLERRPQADVFEYGSGASTVWLTQRAGTVRSVEHDSAFASILRPMLPDPDALIERPAPAELEPRIASRREPDRDFFDYVHAIDSVQGDFDLVVVDGRARVACVAAALPRLKPGGLVLLDDSWRREYREGLDLMPVTVRHLPGAAPCLPYPSVTALPKPDSTRSRTHDEVGQ